MGAFGLHAEGDEGATRDLHRQPGDVSPLNAAEESRLLERSAAGDRASQEKLVAAHLGMVTRLARSRKDRGLSVPDLIQEGSVGLVEAIRLFRPGEATFGRFAEEKVAAQMEAAIATEAAAVREGELLVAAATDYERTQLTLRRELHREASEAEIAQKLEWSLDRTRYVAQVVADARRAYDEEMLAFIDPDAVDVDDAIEG